MGLFTTKRTDFNETRQPGEGYQGIPPAARATPPQALHSRQELPISDELMAKHEESSRRYPRIHLTKGEHVIMEVRRHPIGLISIWAFVSIAAALILLFISYYGFNRDGIANLIAVNANSLPSTDSFALPLLGLAALFILGGLVATYVYNGNLFYLTNESILQYIQTSLFSTRHQQINLVNVDDVSYRQQGILQHVLNYGTLRVSTEGDERNPYIFYLVANPQEVVRTINDAMEEATGFAVRFRQHRVHTDLPPPEQF